MIYKKSKKSSNITFSSIKDSYSNIKIYKWKLLNNILPNKILLNRWGIYNTNVCSFCNVIENYEHYFITCAYLATFWDRITEAFMKIGFTNMKKLEYIVLGYKLKHKNYCYVNDILHLIGYSIYKMFHRSECKDKTVNPICILKSEIEVYIMYTKDSTFIQSFYKYLR